MVVADGMIKMYLRRDGGDDLYNSCKYCMYKVASTLQKKTEVVMKM